MNRKGPRPAWWQSWEPNEELSELPPWAPRAWRVPGPHRWQPPVVAGPTAFLEELEEWELPCSRGWRDSWWRGNPLPPAERSWLRFERDDRGEVVKLHFMWSDPQVVNSHFMWCGSAG